jgi:hypothetical protein
MAVEYAEPLLGLKSVDPAFIATTAARMALETPQIVLDWTYNSAVNQGKNNGWQRLEIYRSTIRYPKTQGEGDLVYSYDNEFVQNEVIDISDGGPTYGGTLAETVCVEDSLTITLDYNGDTFTDDGEGSLVAGVGNVFQVVSSSIDYGTGVWTLTLDDNVPSGHNIVADYYAGNAQPIVFADTGVDAMTIYYYTIFVRYDIDAVSEYYVTDNIGGFSDNQVGAAPYFAVSPFAERYIIAGRTSTGFDGYWLLNRETGFVEVEWSLENIMVSGERLISLCYLGSYGSYSDTLALLTTRRFVWLHTPFFDGSGERITITSANIIQDFAIELLSETPRGIVGSELEFVTAPGGVVRGLRFVDIVAQRVRVADFTYPTIPGASIGPSGSTNYTGTLGTVPVKPQTLTITDGTQTIIDDGSGNLVGDIDPAGDNTIDYKRGHYDVTFLATTTGAVTADYTQDVFIAVNADISGMSDVSALKGMCLLYDDTNLPPTFSKAYVMGRGDELILLYADGSEVLSPTDGDIIHTVPLAYPIENDFNCMDDNSVYSNDTVALYAGSVYDRLFILSMSNITWSTQYWGASDNSRAHVLSGREYVDGEFSYRDSFHILTLSDWLISTDGHPHTLTPDLVLPTGEVINRDIGSLTLSHWARLSRFIGLLIDRYIDYINFMVRAKFDLWSGDSDYLADMLDRIGITGDLSMDFSLSVNLQREYVMMMVEVTNRIGALSALEIYARFFGYEIEITDPGIARRYHFDAVDTYIEPDLAFDHDLNLDSWSALFIIEISYQLRRISDSELLPADDPMARYLALRFERLKPYNVVLENTI